MAMIQRTVNRMVSVNTQGNKEEWNLQGIHDFATSAIVHEDSLTVQDLEKKTGFRSVKKNRILTFSKNLHGLFKIEMSILNNKVKKCLISKD